MDVGIICRLNKARSPFGELVLKNLFPEIDLFSAGLDTFPNSSPEPRVDAIAQNWKLGKVKTTSQHVSAVNERILDCGLIVIAERAMEGAIRSLGYKGTILDFQTSIDEKSFIPVDPVDLPIKELQQELAKVAYCTVRSFRNFAHIRNLHPVHLFTPTREVDSNRAYLMAMLNQSKQPGIIIDVDFRSPGASYSIPEIEVSNLQSIDELESLSVSRREVYSQKWEHPDPESILLSARFKDVIQVLSNKFPIYLVSAPRFTSAGPIPDSYLAALWADTVAIISS